MTSVPHKFFQRDREEFTDAANEHSYSRISGNGLHLKLLQQMNLKVIVERGEDGYFVTHVPSLKSCWSQGKTREEALENIREAIVLYLEPEPTELTQENENHEVVELTL